MESKSRNPPWGRNAELLAVGDDVVSLGYSSGQFVTGSTTRSTCQAWRLVATLFAASSRRPCENHRADGEYGRRVSSRNRHSNQPMKTSLRLLPRHLLSRKATATANLSPRMMAATNPRPTSIRMISTSMTGTSLLHDVRVHPSLSRRDTTPSRRSQGAQMPKNRNPTPP